MFWHALGVLFCRLVFECYMMLANKCNTSVNIIFLSQNLSLPLNQSLHCETCQRGHDIAKHWTRGELSCVKLLLNVFSSLLYRCFSPHRKHALKLDSIHFFLYVEFTNFFRKPVLTPHFVIVYLFLLFKWTISSESGESFVVFWNNFPLFQSKEKESAEVTYVRRFIDVESNPKEQIKQVSLQAQTTNQVLTWKGKWLQDLCRGYL